MKLDRRAAAVLAALASCAWLAGTRPASATLPMQKAAKDAGYAEATTCLYCHNEKLPRKDAHTLNDRGQWLLSEKTRRKAAEIDVTWLKDYKPAR